MVSQLLKLGVTKKGGTVGVDLLPLSGVGGFLIKETKMLRATFLNPKQLTIACIREKVRFLSWRDLAFASIGGIALAGVGQLLGRTFHLAWPVPMSGSMKHPYIEAKK